MRNNIIGGRLHGVSVRQLIEWLTLSEEFVMKRSMAVFYLSAMALTMVLVAGVAEVKAMEEERQFNERRVLTECQGLGGAIGDFVQQSADESLRRQFQFPLPGNIERMLEAASNSLDHLSRTGGFVLPEASMFLEVYQRLLSTHRGRFIGEIADDFYRSLFRQFIEKLDTIYVPIVAIQLNTGQNAVLQLTPRQGEILNEFARYYQGLIQQLVEKLEDFLRAGGLRQFNSSVEPEFEAAMVAATNTFKADLNQKGIEAQQALLERLEQDVRVAHARRDQEEIERREAEAKRVRDELIRREAEQALARQKAEAEARQQRERAELARKAQEEEQARKDQEALQRAQARRTQALADAEQQLQRERDERIARAKAALEEGREDRIADAKSAQQQHEISAVAEQEQLLLRERAEKEESALVDARAAREVRVDEERAKRVGGLAEQIKAMQAELALGRSEQESRLESEHRARLQEVLREERAKLEREKAERERAERIKREQEEEARRVQEAEEKARLERIEEEERLERAREEARLERERREREEQARLEHERLERLAFEQREAVERAERLRKLKEEEEARLATLQRQREELDPRRLRSVVPSAEQSPTSRGEHVDFRGVLSERALSDPAWCERIIQGLMEIIPDRATVRPMRFIPTAQAVSQKIKELKLPSVGDWEGIRETMMRQNPVLLERFREHISQWKGTAVGNALSEVYMGLERKR